MGILPSKTATGVEQNYVVDGTTQATDILTATQTDGDKIGDVLAGVSATSESSNKLSTELDARLRLLEEKYSLLLDRIEALESPST